MEFNEFATEIMIEMQVILGRAYTVGKRYVEKNNGIQKLAVTVKKANTNVEGCLYMEDVYEMDYFCKKFNYYSME
jgi:hypothetical protein